MIGRFILIIAAMIGSLSPINAIAWPSEFDKCLSFFPNHMPPLTDIQNTRALCFSGFAVLYSANTKTPIYSAERLTADRVREAKRQSRTDIFYEEARLPSRDRARLSDYKGSGYDRGHMSPAGDMGDPDSMVQSFSLANMIPQDPDNNRHGWADIEKVTRKYAERNGVIYVVTGPWYADRPIKRIGSVAVPDHIWKLVFDERANRAWVYLVENKPLMHAVAPISYREFVSRTGLNVLSWITP